MITRKRYVGQACFSEFDVGMNTELVAKDVFALGCNRLLLVERVGANNLCIPLDRFFRNRVPDNPHLRYLHASYWNVGKLRKVTSYKWIL